MILSPISPFRVFRLEEDDGDDATIERISDVFIGILIAITETELKSGILDWAIVVSVLVRLLLLPFICVAQ
jgi:hypothetical protein